MTRATLSSELLHDLANVITTDLAEMRGDYAWPPRAPLTLEERAEVDRLEATSRAIRYRAYEAAYEEGDSK